MGDGSFHSIKSRWLALALLLFTVWVGGCKRSPAPPASTNTGRGVKPLAAGTLEITLIYGSEKRAWIDAATAQFNAAIRKSSSGKTILVKTLPMGSGETVDAVLSGREKPDMISPASAAFIKLANYQAQGKGEPPIVASTENLVLSPVVIAMWKPMAQALGWSESNQGGGGGVGWTDILALARDPNGWASKGHPEWGRFRFGHTHPEYSNSGLISVIAETYAAAGKVRDLSADDLAKPAVGAFVHDIETAVVHYGSSTGFFADKMFANGPRYLSAAILYESNVIESYAKVQDKTFPIVAVYPKEGTFWSDHPIGIIQRPWVTDERRDASRQYIQFLLAPPQQNAALNFGFRPADLAASLSTPLDSAHGIDIAQPKTLLEVPTPEIISGMLDLWRTNKKHAEIVLVLDTSGSMSEQNKMAGARLGAAELIKMLHDDDLLSLVPFSTNTTWAARKLPLKTGRDQAVAIVNGLIPDGNTRLFNTVSEAYNYLQTSATPGRITAVVVLTDGADTARQMTLQQLLQSLQFDAETRTTRVFTIGYGSDAQAAELKKIADQTQAKYFDGKPENIREVFKEIATFF